MARFTSALAQAPYIVPFAVFVACLALHLYFPLPLLLLEVALFFTLSRGALTGSPTRPLTSALLGVAVFAIWVGPDLLFPGYRQLPIFSNSVTGYAIASTTEAHQHDLSFLIPRVLISIVTVPILEELFWRGFLLRVTSFWIVALLFASEHGPYWEVGLIAGAIYNWWMLRTRTLWDCIIAHSVTNACLAIFVIAGRHWEYWL